MKFSRKCNELYLQYTDLVDPFGIDESFLDVTGSMHLFGSGEHIADELRRRMREEVGLTISVGVSFNRAFAKLGSDYKKPDARRSRAKIQAARVVLAREHAPVCRQTRQRPAEPTGRTHDRRACACDPAFIHSILGKNGDLLLRYARGEDDEPVRSFYAEREVKSVGNSMTFAHNLLGADECRMGITALCDNVGRRLRKRGMVCQTVQLGIRDPEFHNRSRQVTLERPTNSTRALIDLSMQLLLGHWPMDKPVRLLSVTAANLLPENQSCEQLSLFDAAEDIQKRDRQHKLDQTVDALRQKFGDQSVVFAHSVKKKDKTDKK